MTPEAIRHSLQDHPHVKEVWVKDGAYYTAPVFGAKLVKLPEAEEVPVEVPEVPQQEKKESKKRKAKDNGTE